MTETVEMLIPVLTPSVDARPPASIFVKQTRQSLLLAGLDRILADIYGDRSSTPLTFFVLLRKLGVAPQTIETLAGCEGQPVINKLVDRLSHRLALTAEGQKQYAVINALYGLDGEKTKTVTEVAAMLSTSPKDIKHLSIMMRCRLESETIRAFVEESLATLIMNFERSLLCSTAACKLRRDSQLFAASPAPDMLAALKGLEAQADQLVSSLERCPSVNVSGTAGTGKTSLALKVTTRLLAQGKRVLFVCHSRFFSQHISAQSEYFPGDLTVSTFHSLCHQFAKSAQIEIPSYRNNKVFNELFPELLIAAAHARPEERFDAIVVDEGHSLLPNFWRALKFCLKDLQGGVFFYFYDPTIMAIAKSKNAPFATQNIELVQALRPNFDLVRREDGLEIHEAISRDEIGAAVSKIVFDLLEGPIRPGDIVILTTDTAPKISTCNFKLPRGVKLAATPGNRDRYILYTSLSSFRALTKKVVILTVGRDIEDLADWKQKFLSYSIFSRAEEKLYLVGNLRNINKLLPANVEMLNPEIFEPQLRR